MRKGAYFVFPSVYSMLVYQRYTNTNIGPWWMETQQNIFPTTKHSNSMKIKIDQNPTVWR